MVVIHVSDIHLGANPDTDKPWSLDRGYDIKESFENVIRRCTELKCNLLLIAGDLFNKQPLAADLNEINELFKSIPDTKIVIIAGNKDCIKENSSILSYNFNSNVHYIFSEFPTDYEIPELNTVIHGFSYHQSELTRPLVDTIENPKNDNKIHILLAHGGDINHCPIDWTLLANKNFTYCALGHKHRFEEVVKNKIVYSGCLEPLNVDETGDHGIVVIEIHSVTHRLESVRFEPMAKSSYIQLNVSISENTTNEELNQIISNELFKKNSNNIYKIKLTGDKNPNLDFDFTDLNKNFKIIEIEDESVPKYDFVGLSKEHPNDMIGAFVRSFDCENMDNMSIIQKKALFYGINALMKTLNKE